MKLEATAPRAYDLGKRAESTARTRQRILLAARDLLVESQSMSLEEVALRANVARPTIYRHFDSRKQLMRALVSQISIESGIEKAVGSALRCEDLRSAVAAFVTAATGVWTRESDLIRGALRAAVDPEISSAIEEVNSARYRDALLIAKKSRRGRQQTFDLARGITLLTSPQSLFVLIDTVGMAPKAARSLLRQMAEGLV